MLREHTLSVLRFLALLLVVAGAGPPKGTPAATTAGPPRPAPPLSDPTWALGLRVYRSLRRSSDSPNTLFSPLLLSSSLAALGGGSRGTTASQFQDLLKTPLLPNAGPRPGDRLSDALKSTAEANGTSFHLRCSSAVFSKRAPPVDLAFVKESQAKFRVQYQPLGEGDSKADLKKIHTWSKAVMGGQEGVPLGPEIRTKAGALILANALNFKGLWEREFNEESKDLRTFLGTKYTKVVMMHRVGVCRHYEDIENMVQVLELGLWGGRASLVLLLPFHVESLARLDKLLTLDLLTKWLEKSTEMGMAVSLPKTNISSMLSLQKTLSALGLTDAWDGKTADFSGLSVKSEAMLHLSDALHWASLELTAVAGSGAAALEDEDVQKPKMFYADHSFVVLVRDNTTGALVLMGALDHADGEALHDEL